MAAGADGVLTRAGLHQRVYIKHWLCRIACLIVLPFCVYLTCFKIHFLSELRVCWRCSRRTDHVGSPEPVGVG